MAEIRIRNRQTGETFIGDGPVPEGYDLIGPATAPRPTTSMAPAGPPPGGGPVGNQELVSNIAAAQGPKANPLITGIAPAVGAFAGGSLAGIPGAGIGAAGGELLNQAVGLAEPGLTQPIVSGLTAAGGQAVGRGISTIRGLVGRRGAENLNPMAAQEAQRVVGQLAPTPGEASRLFAAARAQNVTLPASKTLQVIDSSLDDLRVPSSPNRPAIKRLEALRNKIQASNGTVDPTQLQAELEDMGEAAAKASMGGDKSVGRHFSKVRDALLDDLDTAASTANPAMPAAQTLQQARQTYLREKTVGEIQDAITRAEKLNRGQGEATQFNANQVIADLKKNRFYEKALAPQERAEIETALKRFNKIPALHPGAGQQYGFGRVGRAVVTGGAAGGAAYQMGAAVDPFTAGLIGATAPSVAEFARNFALAATNPTGRALLKHLAGNGVTPRSLAILSAYAASVSGADKGE